MIDRYSRPEMKRVWSEENKYDLWLRVELAACEAWTEEGVIPSEDMVLLRQARHDIDRLQEIFQRTRHDMTAFTRSITERLGPEGRWIHLGLTSSDVLDTALALQMKEAAELLDRDMELGDSLAVDKYVYSRPAADDIIEELATSCDFVVTAIAD